MALNIPGLVSIIIFYLVILFIGLFAAYWSKRRGDGTNSENIMVADRNIGVFVGIFTMTATWVGGGYINGTSEAIYNEHLGLIWCQAPWCYALSLLLGGSFYAKKMRGAGFVTMVDVLQTRYGMRMGGILTLPAILGEIFWSAAILGALGSTLMVIVDLNNEAAIIVSACIAVGYTLVGGLISVAYTDVVQLICIFIGLWITIPFAMTHKAARPLQTNGSINWLGAVDIKDAGAYIDSALMLIMGGVPWQVYFQRVLSAKSAKTAQYLSYVAGLGCIIMAIPAVLIGAIAKTADWSQTDYNGSMPLDADTRKLTLPLVMQYMNPVSVSFIGLGAVSAAVMSSADSSVLSVSSLFTRNIVQAVFWPKAKEKYLMWFMRFAVVFVGLIATLIAIYVKTTYGLWFLCSDLVFCILFPQLTCAIYLDWVNTYGSLVAFLVGLFLRLSSGEAIIFLPALIEFPGYYKSGADSYQRFPFRVFIMLVSLICLLSVSYLTHWLFKSGRLNLKYDCFGVYEYASKTNGLVELSKRDNLGKLSYSKNNGSTLNETSFYSSSNTQFSEMAQSNKSLPISPQSRVFVRQESCDDSLKRQCEIDLPPSRSA